MTDTKYNGWTNYATWRVNLEMFDGFDPDGVDYTVLDLADYMKETAIQCVEASVNDQGGFALDYALAFLDDVNWYEIAKHKIEEYA